MKRITFGSLCLVFSVGCHHEETGPDKIKGWFEREAENCDTSKDLHLCSGWSYLNAQQFSEIVMDGIDKLDPPIKDGDSVFEFGVGVGAVLQVIKNKYKNIKIGGSDSEQKAIEVAQKVFPEYADNFNIQLMQERHQHIPDNSYDHVISFGALGMYLTKSQMVQAFKEATRIVKPGGSMVFTSFIEPSGTKVGSIIDKVEKSFWKSELVKLGIENIKIYDMKNQGDGYQIACNKKK